MSFNSKLEDLLKDQKLITIDSKETIESASDKLYSNGITGAPVVENNQLLGFVDVLDLLAFSIKQSTKTLLKTEMGESRYLNTDDVQMLKKRSKDFNKANIQEALDLSKRNKLITIDSTNTLADALNLFAKEGVHRIAVKDKNGLKGILTQSMLLRSLGSGFLKNVKAKDLKCTDIDSAIKVSSKLPACDAFWTMHSNNTSAVAVFSVDGKLFGNLSASDLKGHFGRELNNQLKPVDEFLTESRKELKKPANYLVCVSEDQPGSDIIELMNKEKVHRVFLLDKNTKPLGIIALTDVIRHIASTRQVS